MSAEISLKFPHQFRHKHEQNGLNVLNKLGIYRKNTKYFIVIKSEIHLCIVNCCLIEPGF